MGAPLSRRSQRAQLSYVLLPTTYILLYEYGALKCPRARARGHHGPGSTPSHNSSGFFHTHEVAPNHRTLSVTRADIFIPAKTPHGMMHYASALSAQTNLCYNCQVAGIVALNPAPLTSHRHLPSACLNILPPKFRDRPQL